MGLSYLIRRALLISIVLALCFSLGFGGRKLNRIEREDAASAAALPLMESSEKTRDLTEVLYYPDYPDPEPNPGHNIPPPPEGSAP